MSDIAIRVESGQVESLSGLAAPLQTAPRLAVLDGLRALAILAVVFFHMVEVGAFGGVRFTYFAKLSSLGASGVDLFFVLSGFLIGGILLDHRRSSRFFATFYARRFFRIVPLYAALLLIVMGILHVDRSHSVWPYLTFTQNFAYAGGHTDKYLDVTWSLAVEEHFYLLLPVTVYFVSRKALALLCCAVLMVEPFLRMAVAHRNPWIYQVTVFRLDAFAVGVLIALALRNDDVWKRLLSVKKYTLAIAGLVGVPAILWTVERPYMPPSIWYSFIAVFYGLSVFLCLAYKPAILCGMMAKIGVAAYPIYLFHKLLLDAIGKFRGDNGGITLLFLLSVCPIGYAVHYFTERPLITFASSRFRY